MKPITKSAHKKRRTKSLVDVMMYLLLVAVASIASCFMISDIKTARNNKQRYSITPSSEKIDIQSRSSSKNESKTIIHRPYSVPHFSFAVPSYAGNADDTYDDNELLLQKSVQEEIAPTVQTAELPVFTQLRCHKSKPIPQVVRDLTQEITQDCTNDISKAREIYNWITSNIKYDTVEWKNIISGANDYTHEHDPATVLKRGSTVCIGYAWLFDDMCASAGIESTYLIGDVRGYRGTEDEQLVSNIKHAWSAVKVDDQWKLLDATWGAKQEGETDADYKGRADYYYDTPANQFVFDHLPESEEWQLLEEPIPSKQAFSVLPNLKPTFFTNGLKLGDNYTSTLGAKSDTQYRLAFEKPMETDVAFTIGPASDGEKSKQIRSVTSDSKKGVAAIIPPLHSGDYLLRLYSRQGKGAFSCSADFVIHVE